MASSELFVERRSGLRGWAVMRVIAAVVPLVAIVVIIRATGVMEHVAVEEIRGLVQRADTWGIPLFIAVYGVSILAYVPGAVFVGAGVLAFGPGWGIVWCYFGALLGNLLSFGIVRRTGYRPLARVSWPAAERLFERLAARPTWTVTIIRMIFPTTAPINYALALTDVTFRAYLLGSLLGVVPQLAACVWLFAFVFE